MALKKLRKNKVSMTTISSNTEITNKLIKAAKIIAPIGI